MLKSGIYDFFICRGGTDMCFILGFGQKHPDLKQYHISGLKNDLCMKGVFKCAMEDDERRSWSVKRSSLGMPMCNPNKYSRRLKHLSLGMPPVHPLLHQQLSVRPSFHYIFITSCIMCYAWSVSLFTFLSFFCFACC